MIKIYNEHKYKSRKDILGDYRAELIKRLKEAKKNEYPKFDETLSFSIYDKIYAPKNPGVYFIHDTRGILYIGRTENIYKRFTQHAWVRKNKNLFKLSQNPFGKLKFSWVNFKNIADTKKYESKWVELFLPVCNENYNTIKKKQQEDKCQL